MDWLSATIGGMFDLAGIGMGFGQAAQNHHYAKELQRMAQAHQIKMYKHQNQWRVEDLRKAGLNPILSTHAASSMPSASIGTSSARPTGDFSRTANLVERALWKKGQKENKLLDEQINSAKSQVEANLSLAEKYSAEAFNTDLHSAFEFSRDMINLKKRKLFSDGSANLGQFFGLFKDEVDKFTGYQPWHTHDKGENVWDLPNSPRRTGRDRFNYKK